ncbi:MAG: transglycosylase domain-containing protein [Deltaproteobacteria bacterium]|nr:transglycosylase domain-containing protein [Deltaproteobacteria bacterium]
MKVASKIFRLRFFRFRAALIFAAGAVLALSALLWLATARDLKDPPRPLSSVFGGVEKLRVLDRFGIPLSTTYRNSYNIHDYAYLHEIPQLLQQAFIMAEDRRFYSHKGADWAARFNAAFQNLLALKVVRGASTITEQTARLVNPRPRGLWSRWLYAFEAGRMEKSSSKAEILEFYLNEVPFAGNRRGVAQAARFYFNRDLATLSVKESLALAVMARSPSRLSPHRNPAAADAAIARLASAMKRAGLLTEDEAGQAESEVLSPAFPGLSVSAFHFAERVLGENPPTRGKATEIRTTLDSGLQDFCQKLLDQSVARLASRDVGNAALLVADHETSEVLAYVVSGNGEDENAPSARMDAVTALRQPGSALKPFAYALALERGWTPETIIVDEPMSEKVGRGIHRFKNYSRTHYGPLTLREALGNSLNIPAIKTVQFTGVGDFLAALKSIGFSDLSGDALYYGAGLVLGDGEVSLWQMVSAYAALGRMGEFRPLVTVSGRARGAARRVFSQKAAEDIALILSDPNARTREFGSGGVLEFPVETAVKTGTSSDYHDSWAMGYNFRYTAGVWMGNLSRKPMQRVTGSVGPGLVLRAVFARLAEGGDTRPLAASAKGRDSSGAGDGGENAVKAAPAAVPGRARPSSAFSGKPFDPEGISLDRPFDGLKIAEDPRIPDQLEFYDFRLSGVKPAEPVAWNIDGAVFRSKGSRFSWQVKKGRHAVSASVRRPTGKTEKTLTVDFEVR